MPSGHRGSANLYVIEQDRLAHEREQSKRDMHKFRPAVTLPGCPRSFEQDNGSPPHERIAAVEAAFPH